MKIAYFLGTLKNEDGVTRVLSELIKEGQKNEIESIIITGWAENESSFPIPIIQIPSFIFPLYKEYRIPLPGMHGFEKQLDKFHPDIIHIHSPDTSAWAALKYEKKNKIPIVATFHTDFCSYLPYYHLSFLRPLVWFILKKIYTQMSFVTTPSEVVSNMLIQHKIKNVYTVPWGVELEKFNTSFYSLEWRNKILKREKQNIILYVGRLTWEKDLRTLVNVFKLLKNNKDNFKMVIVGDGPARRKLETLMPEALFVGHLEGLELSKVYASCDIFLFPSYTETFGNVTIEAMASGLVIVAANAGGSKSIILDNENGFLAEPKNTDDFYNKICLLLENKQLQEKIKNNNLDFVKTHTWEKVFDNLLQKYLKILS
ncbi:MAG: glycosyltransferase family 1 protein [Candidatus Paceibacterota bacterium]